MRSKEGYSESRLNGGKMTILEVLTSGSGHRDLWIQMVGLVSMPDHIITVGLHARHMFKVGLGIPMLEV